MIKDRNLYTRQGLYVLARCRQHILTFHLPHYVDARLLSALVLDWAVALLHELLKVWAVPDLHS